MLLHESTKRNNATDIQPTSPQHGHRTGKRGQTLSANVSVKLRHAHFTIGRPNHSAALRIDQANVMRTLNRKLYSTDFSRLRKSTRYGFPTNASTSDNPEWCGRPCPRTPNKRFANSRRFCSPSRFCVALALVQLFPRQASWHQFALARNLAPLEAHRADRPHAQIIFASCQLKDSPEKKLDCWIRQKADNLQRGPAPYAKLP